MQLFIFYLLVMFVNDVYEIIIGVPAKKMSCKSFHNKLTCHYINYKSSSFHTKFIYCRVSIILLYSFSCFSKGFILISLLSSRILCSISLSFLLVLVLKLANLASILASSVLYIVIFVFFYILPCNIKPLNKFRIVKQFH